MRKLPHVDVELEPELLVAIDQAKRQWHFRSRGAVIREIVRHFVRRPTLPARYLDNLPENGEN